MKVPPPHRRLRLDDASGLAILEFAIVAPIFIALMIAILQTSLVFFHQQVLETAAQAAARAMITGKTVKNNMQQADLLALACNKLPGTMNCSNLYIDSRAVTQWSQATAPPPTYNPQQNQQSVPTQYTQGAPGQIIMLRLMYQYNVISGPLNFNLSNFGAGQRLLIATVVAKTEPYQ